MAWGGGFFFFIKFRQFSLFDPEDVFFHIFSTASTVRTDPGRTSSGIPEIFQDDLLKWVGFFFSPPFKFIQLLITRIINNFYTINYEKKNLKIIELKYNSRYFFFRIILLIFISKVRFLNLRTNKISMLTTFLSSACCKTVFSAFTGSEGETLLVPIEALSS